MNNLLILVEKVETVFLAQFLSLRYFCNVISNTTEFWCIKQYAVACIDKACLTTGFIRFP